ncbi:DUF4209 domain-containing protein [Campylobacter ureolyticus]|uniref:DUF4209 domain-containing protein n=1 Tax=Campylobacter ureolyticus TaxID=827 RepID=UPI0022B4A7CA|nr:DUF4209 domain-containing protein [Campylobacter ureolyticus]MCZ6156622.1 DUF4209 domain-containing protein [Campylobacter ureolyticus]
MDVLTLENFTKLDYMEILQNLKNKTCLNYSTIFNKLTKSYKYSKNAKEILNLLSNICSIGLKVDSYNEPFIPMFQNYQKRTFLPDDLTKDELYFLNQILNECKDFRIKARIADILWIYYKPKDIKYLKIAIQEYSKFPIDNFDNALEFSEAISSYKRAIFLANSTKNKELLSEIVNRTTNAFLNLQNNNYILKLNDILKKLQLKDKLKYEIIEKLKIKTNNAQKISYLEEIRNWYIILGNTDEENNTTIEIINTYIELGNNKNYSCYYEMALKEYYSLPNKIKENLDIDKDFLYGKIERTNKIQLRSIEGLEISPINISNLTDSSINMVKNKDISTALRFFTNGGQRVDFTNLKKQSENISQNSIASMFKHIQLSQDGKKISEEPYENIVLSINYNIHFSLTVYSFIIPALNQILMEHRISKEYIYNICNNSLLIDKNRVNLWTKGLHLGFEHEFLLSAHILIPQIEYLIRFILKENNVTTTIIDNCGIETEKSLNKLLKEEKLQEILEIDLIKELQYLLIQPTSYNLRNEIVHALVDDNIDKVGIIYLWWLCFRLIYNMPYK